VLLAVPSRAARTVRLRLLRGGVRHWPQSAHQAWEWESAHWQAAKWRG